MGLTGQNNNGIIGVRVLSILPSVETRCICKINLLDLEIIKFQAVFLPWAAAGTSSQPWPLQYDVPMYFRIYGQDVHVLERYSWVKAPSVVETVPSCKRLALLAGRRNNLRIRSSTWVCRCSDFHNFRRIGESCLVLSLQLTRSMQKTGGDHLCRCGRN